MQTQFIVPNNLHYLKFFPELGSLQVCTEMREGMGSLQVCTEMREGMGSSTPSSNFELRATTM